MIDATAMSASALPASRPVALSFPFTLARADRGVVPRSGTCGDVRERRLAGAGSFRRRQRDEPHGRDVAAHCRAHGGLGILGLGPRPDVRRVLGGRLPARVRRRPGTRRGYRAALTNAGAGRRHRRRPANGRLRIGRHRDGHPRGRQPRLRLRPPALQSRPHRVPDDDGGRAGGPAEPHAVEQARQHGPGGRHAAAGPCHGHRRHPRPRAVDDPGDHHAQFRSRPFAVVLLRRRPRPVVHAAPHLPGRRERADVVRARRGARGLLGARIGDHPLPGFHRVRGHLHRRPAGRRGVRLRRGTASRRCSRTPRNR